MRYECLAGCTDFDGAVYRRGEVVELLETERHSDFLKPVSGVGRKRAASSRRPKEDEAPTEAEDGLSGVELELTGEE